jgi:hypothetical protein
MLNPHTFPDKTRGEGILRDGTKSDVFYDYNHRVFRMSNGGDYAHGVTVESFRIYNETELSKLEPIWIKKLFRT